MAHGFGHHVLTSMEEWYTTNQPFAGVEGPRGAWNELLADCFGGNWTQAVYPQGALQGGDYMEAIAILASPGPEDPHGARNHRVGAYRIGVEGVPTYNYQPGSPQSCIDYYWKAYTDYTHGLVLPAG